MGRTLTVLLALAGSLSLGSTLTGCGGDAFLDTDGGAAVGEDLGGSGAGQDAWTGNSGLDAGASARPDLGSWPDQGSVPDQAGAPDQGEASTQIPVGNASCAGAQRLQLSNGRVTVKGHTSPAVDEFPQLKCKSTGGSSTPTLDGPQVYYKFAAAKDSWYRVELDPSFSAYLYLFTASSCAEADLQADCQSGGLTGESSTVITSGKREAVYFKAPATGDIYLAVDSSADAGAFTLTVENIAAPANGTCVNAEPLTFSAGRATARGDTGPKITPDEFPALKCGTSSTFDGPQAYYRFTAAANQPYLITLTASSATSISFYVFKAGCSEAAIEASCASDGVSGLVLPSTIASGNTGALTFTPQTAGEYVIAVDSRVATAYGSFTLAVREVTVPANGKCKAAETIALSNGKAVVHGSTAAAADEFPSLKCRTTANLTSGALDGPQVYYKLVATPYQWYRVTLDPTFTAYVYAFTSASCSAADIQSDCQSGGTKGLASTSVARRKFESIYLQAPASGVVYLAVDSTSPGTFGEFTLFVEQFALPSNSSCSKAAPLTFTGDTATVTGDVADAFTRDEFPTLKCKGSGETLARTMGGPQVYYRFAATKGQHYKIVVDPTFSAYAYVFTAGACSAAGIAADCQSLGATGEASSMIVGWRPETIYFEAPATGDVWIGVEGASTSAVGPFTLEVTKLAAPTNGTCVAATPLSLVAGVAKATGEIGPQLTPDEFSGVKCGKLTAFDGPQAYYRFAATAGTPYEITVTAETSSSIYFYVFGSSCSEAAIDAACSSKGQAGNVSTGVAQGDSRSLVFVPPADGSYTVAVDKTTATDYGGFAIAIAEQPF